MYDNQVSHLGNVQMNVDSMAFASENITDTINTVSTLVFIFSILLFNNRTLSLTFFLINKDECHEGCR